MQSCLYMYVCIYIHNYKPVMLNAVTIGLERDEYTVEEGTGEIEVCAVVKSGAVQRDAVLSFCTEMATAIGKPCRSIII